MKNCFFPEFASPSLIFRLSTLQLYFSAWSCFETTFTSSPVTLMRLRHFGEIRVCLHEHLRWFWQLGSGNLHFLVYFLPYFRIQPIKTLKLIYSYLPVSLKKFAMELRRYVLKHTADIWKQIWENLIIHEHKTSKLSQQNQHSFKVVSTSFFNHLNRYTSPYKPHCKSLEKRLCLS